MTELRFKLKGRKAYLKDIKYSEEFKNLLSYSVPGARFAPSYNTRNEDGKRLWDGKTSMFKNNSVSVGLLIGAYKEIKAGGFKPRITKWKDRPQVALKNGFWEKSKKYDYQNQATQAILDSFSKGGGTVLSATGTGKTKLAAQCFSHIIGKCLFIVDQIHLLYQSREEISVWLKEKVGIIGNGKWEPQRVTVATIQTLSGHKDKEYFKKWAKNITVMFIDELHKQMARRNFTVLSRVKPQAVIGLTATLQMKKKITRWKVFSISGPIIFSFPLSDGVEAGVLTKAAVVQVNVPYVMNDKLIKKLSLANREWVESNYDPIEDNSEGGYGKYKPLDPYVYNVVCNKNITHKVIPDLVRKALDANKACIILANRIAHVELLGRKLSSYSPAVLRGATDSSIRRTAIRKFESGKSSVIVASSIFTKGINIKRVSFIIDAAELPNKDDAMQKLGRGVRLHEDKDGLIYVDLSTSPHNKKAASSRRNAFKKAKVPVEVIQWSNAKAVLTTARKLLR